MKPMDVAGIDERLRRRRARGVRPSLYDRRLAERRARLLADAEFEAHREAKARVTAERRAVADAKRLADEARADEATNVWLDASLALLDCVLVGTEDREAIVEILSMLNDTFPQPIEEEDEPEPEGADLFRFPPLD